MLERGSGILLHISSINSPFGIGDFGPQAYEFVDFLHASEQKYWQVLPLTPTDTVYGNSPYSSHSAFAINPLFISPALLREDQLIQDASITGRPSFKDERVDYRLVTEYKEDLFEEAFNKFKGVSEFKDSFNAYCNENEGWLIDYCLFLVLKRSFEGLQWNQWPEPYQRRDKEALRKIIDEKSEEIEKNKFIQFIAHQQWKRLREYCTEKGVKVIGDIPIYVNFDSADVWANPDIFDLDKSLQQNSVAGVPPDYFSETGQRWGNPIYNWDKLKENDYEWWIKRMQHTLEFFDLIRVDHFRGFVDFWKIPAGEETAINGQWTPGPGDDFFETLIQKLPNCYIIAEDLGIITQEVTDTMKRFDFPGMKVLMFAFGGDIKTHPYIPDNYEPNYVAYTGTHDNNTVLGWIRGDANIQEKDNLYSYMGKRVKDEDLPKEMIRLVMESRANLCIVPMQDVLCLDADCRMNKPATVNGNWSWRVRKEDLTVGITQRLSHLVKSTNR